MDPFRTGLAKPLSEIYVGSVIGQGTYIKHDPNLFVTFPSGMLEFVLEILDRKPKSGFNLLQTSVSPQQYAMSDRGVSN
jgi:hypothetical protein